MNKELKIVLSNELFWVKNNEMLASGVNTGLNASCTLIFKNKAAEFLYLLEEGENSFGYFQKKLALDVKEFQNLVETFSALKIILLSEELSSSVEIMQKGKDWEVVTDNETTLTAFAAGPGDFCGSYDDGLFYPCPSGYSCQPGSGNWCDPWYCRS